MHDSEHELLSRLAYQSWLDRGKPYGSPEVDWSIAVQHLTLHGPITRWPKADPNHEQLDPTDDA